MTQITENRLKVISEINKFTDLSWQEFLSKKTEEEHQRINLFKTMLDAYFPHEPILVKLFTMPFLGDSKKELVRPKVISSIKNFLRPFHSKKVKKEIKELSLEVLTIALKIWLRSKSIDDF